MKRSLLFLLLLTIIASCTVTKRVHRKGWHVEWRSSLKTDKQSILNNSTDPSKCKIETSEHQFESISIRPVNSETKRIRAIEEVGSDSETLINVEIPKNRNLTSNISEKSKYHSQLSDSYNNSTSEARPEDRRGLFIATIIFFILFLLSALLAISLYSSLSSAVGFGAGFGIMIVVGFFGILAFVFFIISFITLIAAMAA